MEWRRVRYGPLRRPLLIKEAEDYKGRNSVLVKKFWRSLIQLGINYSIRKDWVSQLFLAHFFYEFNADTVFTCEFKSREELLYKAASLGMSFEKGYDFVQLEEAYARKGKVLTDRVYLDVTTGDELKKRPKPMHEHEVEVSPNFARVKEIRDEVMQEFCSPEDIAYFQECRNTFELHAEDSQDPTIVALQQEKFNMLADLEDETQYRCDDSTWQRAICYALLDTFDFDSDGDAVELSVNFNISELTMMGCHNSAKGGINKGFCPGQHTKASMNAVSTLETLGLIKDCATNGQMTIRPHTMNAKDETNKPGKKEKMFNMLDHAVQKLHYLFYGDYTDRHRARIQSGYLMGVSLVGGEIDEALRLQLGISLGKGRLSDEDLKELKVMQTDFAGFEFHPDKHAHLLLAWARMIRFGGGVKDQMGNPSPTLKIALSSEFERKLLPDLRVGGMNNVFTTPGIQISGEPDTLTWNEEMHKLMVLFAQWEYNLEVDRWLPDDTPNFEASPKNGDDGIYPITSYNEAVLEKLEGHDPVKFTTEKRGSFLSEIDEDAMLLNDGISYCKMNFVLEDGQITLRRHRDNMYKVVVGNKSSWEPRAAMQACISQTQNTYGNDKYYNILKEKFERMEKEFGKLSEMGKSLELDFRDDYAARTRLAMDYFPTQEDVKRLLYTRDEIKIRQVHNNLFRHYAYNVPAAGVAKF